ncbi:alpha/beta-hydrolase [Auriscalpium vulgare]|uniref:Alpha/beta-hydrolase n=1 Tax=Auriscalpium vulgare TaxID=40419 RepID=A0ACB8RFK6_9AGAM|nr:alpha/beta-hydrolase [Auriscalpium vulgare]
MTSTPKVTEGEAPFSWPAANKPLTTYYKITGDLSTSTRPPLIVLHGGPGISHIYLTPFADLAAAHGIPVILYDQIGNGRSTHLRERAGDGAFWTDALFVAQLDALIAALGVAEYDLAGHSWGGMLAARFAVRRPQGLRRLVIASSPADMHTWVKVQNELLKEMPEDVQESLRKHEAAGTTDTEEYKAAVEKFYARHLCRLNPLPDDVQAVEKVIEDDPTVYLTMFVHPLRWLRRISF